ncbi:NADPH-dependent FMN reductase [Leptospira ognonensis]|nr:NADPH-dependent FMN reductase [Leptospira ognonensis]
MKKILAISGSTRANSSNKVLIDVIKEMSKDKFQMEKFPNVNLIPHFNPDEDFDNPPAEVVQFRNLIRAVDAVLICTPEYAMGVPGSLKNAIDWLVSSCEFSKKPTALITASSLGEKGHAALIETLKVIEANVVPETQLVISFIKTKLVDGKLIDKETESRVRFVMSKLYELIVAKEGPH